MRNTVLNAVNKCTLKCKKEAIDTLHAASQAYVIGTLENANLLAVHSHRYMLQP